MYSGPLKDAPWNQADFPQNMDPNFVKTSSKTLEETNFNQADSCKKEEFKPKTLEQANAPFFSVPVLGALFLAAAIGFFAGNQSAQPSQTACVPQTDASQSINQSRTVSTEKPDCNP